MPKARAFDGGHTVFTDHSIPRRPRPTEANRDAVVELSPYFDRKLPESIAQRNLGMAYANLGAVTKAWPLLRAAAQTKPRDALLYSQIALLLEADGRLEQAIDFYRKSLEIDSGQDTALARLGILLAKHGSPIEGRSLLQRALIRNPRQPETRKALAALR
jgi:tetratricopeptide (TPR) repeat protein